MTVNLLEYDLESLAAFCERLGEKRFRAVQLFRWIHQRGCSNFEDMSDLAKSLREKLKGVAHVKAMEVISQHISADGTIKWLFDVGGGNAVETVFIPEDDRGTLCLSTQAGCAMGCRFCSTGHQGFSRNLTTGEIIGQLWFAEHFLRKHLQRDDRVISNTVMMAAKLCGTDSCTQDDAGRPWLWFVSPPCHGVNFRLGQKNGLTGSRMSGGAGRLPACSQQCAARLFGATQHQAPA